MEKTSMTDFIGKAQALRHEIQTHQRLADHYTKLFNSYYELLAVTLTPSRIGGNPETNYVDMEDPKIIAPVKEFIQHLAEYHIFKRNEAEQAFSLMETDFEQLIN